METRPYHVLAYRIVSDAGQDSENVHYDHEVIGETIAELITNIEQLLYEVMVEWAGLGEHDMRYADSIRIALKGFKFSTNDNFVWRAWKTPHGRTYKSIDFQNYRVEFRQVGGSPLVAPWDAEPDLSARLCATQDRLLVRVRILFEENVAEHQRKIAEKDEAAKAARIAHLKAELAKLENDQ